MVKRNGVDDVRRRLEVGDALVGTFLNIGSSVATEIAGIAGFDWAVLDLEHGSGSEATLLSQLQALAPYGVVPVVRVESNDRPRFAFALDRGAAGIMVPRVGNAAEAIAAVSYLRYPPDGIRGVATLNRACDFGRSADVIPTFNEMVLGVMQIESPEGVEASREIAGVDGVDVLFVGPMDLSHAMGLGGQIDHEDFWAALTTVCASARAAGKASGILARSTSAAEAYYDEGFQFIAIGSDSSFLLQSMTDVAMWRPTSEAATQRKERLLSGSDEGG